MSNIIEDLYYGNIEPQELSTEISAKLKNKLSNLAEKEEQLTAKLNGEDKEQFLNYVSAYIEFSSLSNEDSFISGFRLGARFTYDTFIDTKGSI
jgi:hypothetical protein